MDAYGNIKQIHVLTTIKIPQNTINDNSCWISIFIPVSAMANDTNRLRTVSTYEKIGNTLVTNGAYSGPTMTLESTISENIFKF